MGLCESNNPLPEWHPKCREIQGGEMPGKDTICRHEHTQKYITQSGGTEKIYAIFIKIYPGI